MSRCLRHRFASRVLPTHREEGQIVVVVALCFIVFIGMLGSSLTWATFTLFSGSFRLPPTPPRSPARRNSRTARCRRIPRRSPTTEQREPECSLRVHRHDVGAFWLSEFDHGRRYNLMYPNSGVGQTRSRPSACRRIHRVAPRTRSAWSRRLRATNLHGALHFGATTLSATATGSETGGIRYRSTSR